ncbi:hypothetical protein [Nonomuraea sp. NPDC048901]|uniref:hypothetical protein n=1 Tax=Nonomuraea sp. NPDC048901 TaxID=3155627 RepID=UPI0033E8C136
MGEHFPLPTGEIQVARAWCDAADFAEEMQFFVSDGVQNAVLGLGDLMEAE